MKDSKIKYLYVLTSTPDDYYSEQVYLSAYTLKDSNPQAFLSLLTDRDTYLYLTNYFVKLLVMFDECKVIDVSFKDNFEKSRYLKTTMREHINGDFLYIDGDTIICDDLSEIENCEYDVAGVLANNQKTPPKNTWTKRYAYLGYGETPSDFFNGGLLYVKDTELAHDFFKEWNSKWTQCLNSGVKHDQPSLNKTNTDFGNIMGILPDKWNMQTFFNGGKTDNAKIVHYFASLKKISGYLDVLFKKLRVEKSIDPNFKETLLNAIKNREVRKKYFLSECLIIRDENQYLIEHLTKGIQSGIEHFFIYDNMSVESVEDYLTKNKPDLLEYCTIEIFPSTDRIQVDCYDKFLEDHREDTKWCAFIDTDEIFEGNLKDFCKKRSGNLCIRFQQIMHGCNGQAFADFSKTMTERFKDHVFNDFFYYKCVVQVEFVLAQLAHFSYLHSKDIPMNNWLVNIPSSNKDCQLHHYYFRSFEEWCMKIKRGGVTAKMMNKVNHFFTFRGNKGDVIPEEDKNAVLEKYGLKIDDVIKYDKRDGNS